MTAQEWIDAAQERADAATEFDWTHNEYAQVRIAHAWGHDLMSATRQEDAEFIAAARTDLPKALDALRDVLSIHRKEDRGRDTYCCTACETEPDVEDAEAICVEWPCSTVQVIATALGTTP